MNGGAGRGDPVVAIDGPAGSGKSTVAAQVAHALGVPHVDTGALYRAAALACVRAGVDLDDPDACTGIVDAVTITREDDRTFLDGEDVEEEIRGEVVTAAVSRVSAHAGVRDALVPAQRRAARHAGGVVEGRDIGTVVLPDADLKVFLTASVEERARRRAAQLGRDDVEALAATLAQRDAADGGRALAPLVAAEDAWILDTTELALEQVVERVVERARSVAGSLDPVRARQGLPRVAVVGRPNVGKSTLVNRILGRRAAIVEHRPGVTRDRVEHLASWNGSDIVLVDTGGWEQRAEGLAARVAQEASTAAEHADVVLFVVDATVGALDDDERFARQLRRSGTPVLLVANKVDGPRQEPLVHELHRLGLGEPHPVSALHGRGVGELLDEVLGVIGPAGVVAPDESGVARVAIVGRPNVGKSSLLNHLVGAPRVLVDEVAHTTRDAVDTMVELDGRPWVFVDTAGMRRRYRRGEDTELYAVDRTRDAIAGAHLVVFVVDASRPLGEQDQRLAALLRDAGRAIVMVCNKWDLVDTDRRTELDRELDRLLSFAEWAPRMYISAETGRGVRRLPGQLARIWENYHRRVPTRELNRLVEDAVAAHAPPRRGNRSIRIRYATQAETAPPRILLFANADVPDGYRRYLERVVREHYDFTGVPVFVEERRSRRSRSQGRTRR